MVLAKLKESALYYYLLLKKIMHVRFNKLFLCILSAKKNCNLLLLLIVSDIKTLFNYMNHSNDIPQNELASLRSFYLP